jgi:leucyl-tRNA synthetase
VQKEWEDSKIFHQDADPNTEKFMATFYYDKAYDSVRNVFLLSKIEFSVAYQRMKGKCSLFPLALQYSGLRKKIPISTTKFDEYGLLSPDDVIQNLKTLGFGIDERRTFDTAFNPFYKSFVRWYCEYLKKTNKIAFTFK